MNKQKDIYAKLLKLLKNPTTENIYEGIKLVSVSEQGYISKIEKEAESLYNESNNIASVINFLSKKKLEYKNCIDPSYLAVSGHYLTLSGQKSTAIGEQKIDNLIEYYSKKLNDHESSLINWIDIFDNIDIEQKFIPKAYITSSISQKKNYFSEASFNLTIQYIKQFKTETYLLSTKRKLDYIDSLKIEKPNATNTESSLFNQTVFEAQNNYFEFLILYKSVLENVPSKQDEAKPEQEKPTFTNNFDKIDTLEIYKHFKDGLVDKGYLTESELNEFLKSAFELKSKPEKLFTIKNAPNKATIEAVFYKYYKNIAGKVHGKQTEYAALLGDYFEGYKTSNVSSNFSKSVY